MEPREHQATTICCSWYVVCCPEKCLGSAPRKGTFPKDRHAGQTLCQQDARTAKTIESHIKQGNKRWQGRTEWRTGGMERNDTQIQDFCRWIQWIVWAYEKKDLIINFINSFYTILMYKRDFRVREIATWVHLSRICNTPVNFSICGVLPNPKWKY